MPFLYFARLVMLHFLSEILKELGLEVTKPKLHFKGHLAKEDKNVLAFLPRYFLAAYNECLEKLAEKGYS
jgi:hypothetical protein